MAELGLDELPTVDEAIAVLDAMPVVLRRATLPLHEAVGCVLAREVVADRDHPAFDKSLVDGYAIRAADAVAAGASLVVVDEVFAGRLPRRAIGAGEATKIMTGAPLPAGADACVPVERTTRAGDRVTLHEATTPGRFVARRGSDCRSDAAVLPAGTRVAAPQVAVAATIGAASLEVFARPTVTILSTGDELVGGEGASAIRDANGPMLATLLRSLGAEVVACERVGDDRDAVRDAIERGLASDVFVSSGGVSMGEADHVPGLLRELGVSLAITKLRIKPGKPFVFGTHNRNGPGRGFAFGLPGNPVSAFCCTLRLVSRIVHRLRGEAIVERWCDATLACDLPANGGREFYQPAVLAADGVRPMQWIGSADVFTLSRANALLIRAIDDRPRVAGETVRCWELPT
jgi:molybdopterin molybdotransferase